MQPVASPDVTAAAAVAAVGVSALSFLGTPAPLCPPRVRQKKKTAEDPQPWWCRKRAREGGVGGRNSSNKIQERGTRVHGSGVYLQEA